MERRRIIERTKATLSVISVLSMLTALFSFVYAEQQIALTWYVIRTEVELPYWLEMADRFMELNPQYAVDVMNEPSGGVAKLTTMIAAGVAPDVVRGETNWMPDYAGKGWFVDLEPYVERDRAALRDCMSSRNRYWMPSSSTACDMLFHKWYQVWCITTTPICSPLPESALPNRIGRGLTWLRYPDV